MTTMTDMNKKISPKRMTQIWIKFMDYGGCNPMKQSFFKKLVNLFYIICSLIVIILSVLEIILTEFTSLTHFTKIVIIIVGYFQVTIKFITCRLKAETLSAMIDIIWNKFWPLEAISDISINKKLLKTYKFIKIATKIYSTIILGSVFSVIGTAILTGNRNLPIDVWIPNKNILKQSPYYEIFYGFQVVFMFTHDLFCVIPTDSLFATMIGLVYCQFNIIKDCLMQIGGENTVEEDFEVVKKCVDHHNLLLRFLEMLESVYSKAILPIIGSGLCLATLNLYAIVMEDDNSLKGMFIILYICIFSQLYFYCQAGEIIQNEVESIGDAAYNCRWTNISNKKITFSLQLIILRSQKRFNITAGGFMILNLENFASVVQTSFSFLTFLENVKS